jgi:hypothetical protein
MKTLFLLQQKTTGFFVCQIFVSFISLLPKEKMLIMQNNTTINPDEYPDAEFEPDSSVSLAAVMTNEPCCQFLNTFD